MTDRDHRPDAPGSSHSHAHDHDHDDAGTGNCEEALHELYTFLDGELTEAKRSQITHHLDDCSPCLEAYDFEAELRDVVRHRCRDEVPESLRDQVARKLAGFDAAIDPVRDGAPDVPLGP